MPKVYFTFALTAGESFKKSRYWSLKETGMNCEQSVLLETTFNKLFDRKYKKKKKKPLIKNIQNVLVYSFAKIFTDIDQSLFM